MPKDVSDQFWGSAELHLTAGMRVPKDVGPEERRRDACAPRVSVQDVADGNRTSQRFMRRAQGDKEIARLRVDRSTVTQVNRQRTRYRR